VHEIREQAVVLGAGFAGLLAAAALAEHFSTVTVVERDLLPDKPIARRGVPQGRHLHSLLARGPQVIEDLLPGFLDDLAVAGAVVLDDVDLHRIYTRSGRYTVNRTGRLADPAALVMYLASRPFLEFQLRQRNAALGNVSFLDGRDVGEFVTSATDRITGVTVIDRAGGACETLEADLVIDATGRATRTPALLARLGYDQPPQRTFTTNGVYHSQQIAIPEQDNFPERLVLVLPTGHGRRGGLVACEGNTWTFTISGRYTELGRPPTNFTEMLALADDFMPAHIMPALRHAQPLTEVSTHRYPGGLWRRYDQMASHPSGLLVLGDALCCLDPINGQGMTMAALQAQVLRSQLRHPGPADPTAFYAACAAVIAPVWATNQPAGTAARRRGSPLRQRTLRWTRRKIVEAAEHDIVVTERLTRVANLIDAPRRVLEPPILARVIAHHTRRALTPTLRR
jgi:2-polyprenyl-6-methoxyphenol hydroxylase-like FAD-dependent oxidoreductase